MTCYSTTRLCLVLAMTLAAVDGAAALTLTVSPTDATNTKPLVITVRGEAFCPTVSEPILGDGVVTLEFYDFCPTLPPSYGPFAHHDLVGPLEPGIWEVRLVDLGTLVTPPPVVASVEVTVTDPRYAIELTPSPATEDDEVMAHLTYLTFFGSCVSSEPPEIGPDRIGVKLQEELACGSPLPPGTYETDQSLGQLAAGDYLVEFFFDGVRVAERELSVLPSGACVPGDETLCLNGGRFRVQATWTNHQGASDIATAVGETDETGFFWFFEPDNIELVVKVLDACGTSFNSFWVFAAGLTDVGVELVVTDTATDTTVTYQNPLGTRFVTIADTAAFDTCP